MSVERMRILLGLDTVGDVATTERRLQITPDMKFTCDGMITKWIIGAGWRNNDVNLYPELQVWRNSGNDIYQKINGTFITVQTRSEDQIYEYSNFPPIPFQSGDVLGVFIPRDSRSKLRLISEGGHGPTNYYITTESVSAYENIDLQHNTPQVLSAVYHALVTVEISENEIRIYIALSLTNILFFSYETFSYKFNRDNYQRYLSTSKSV